jgi:hypothetical protein
MGYRRSFEIQSRQGLNALSLTVKRVRDECRTEKEILWNIYITKVFSILIPLNCCDFPSAIRDTIISHVTLSYSIPKRQKDLFIGDTFPIYQRILTMATNLPRHVTLAGSSRPTTSSIRLCSKSNVLKRSSHLTKMTNFGWTTISEIFPWR